MLKRILDSLRKKEPAKVSPAGTSATSPSGSELITVYDGYGRELKITRKEWREKVLAPNLQKAADNPDELYQLIVSALNDGFTEDVRDASSRLLAIDPLPERSHVVRAIVLMQDSRPGDAEAILLKGIAKVGETGSLLTNLAKAYADRGERGKADETLWRSIRLDPNQDNGLLWWATMEREREGDSGFVRALEKAAALPGSWRPQLWLARHHLEHGDVDGARTLYDSVIRLGTYSSEALMMISGDLGNNGQVALIPEVVAPAFDPERHDPRAGINLLQAYLALGRRHEGEALLDRLYALNLAPYKQHLDRYTVEFQQIRARESSPTPIDAPEKLEIVTITLERPVWACGLHDPDWLFAVKPADAPRVIFLSLAKRISASAGAEVQREDDLGRLSRAIPLYLAESVHYWTDLQSSAHIPVVKGGGPVVFGAGGDDSELCGNLASSGRFLVTGEIDGSADKWRIVCRLWDCARRSRLLEETVEAAPGDVGPAVFELEQRLLTQLGHGRSSPVDDFYARPSREAMGPYLAGLGQSLMLSLMANEIVPKKELWGERGMLEWPLSMALEWPGAEVPKLMYISGLAKAEKYQSGIVQEFRVRTLDFIKDARRTNSTAARLEPIVWRIFGMKEELATFKAALGTGDSEVYRRWVQRVLDDA